MTLNASIGRRLLRAGTIAATFAAWPAVAQQPAPQPAAPAAAAPTGPAAAPPWAQGRPEAAIGVPLAPIAPPPIPTAADKLPIEKLKAPKGFKIELYAAGVGNARTLRQGDKGTVFVGSRLLDKVYAIVEKDGKREVKTIYSGLYRPHGLAFKDGTLYIAELSPVGKSRGSLARRPAGPVRADPALSVPRETASRRADDASGTGSDRRRSTSIL